MLEFVRNGFRKYIEAILWLNLIFCTIGGGVLFYFLTGTRNFLRGSYEAEPVFVFLGLIIGFVHGIMTNIIGGGFIATILNIDKNVEILSGKNSSGVATKKEIAPVEKGSFTDPRDNKTYKTVKIGTQIWMAENLAYECKGSKFYDNNPANCKKYGRLYNWETAKKACPAGWHLPTEDEWDILMATVGGEKTAGKHLKAVNGWNYSGNGDDAFGFSAFPSGYGGSDGSFGDVGECGFWWSATEGDTSKAYYRSMDYDYDDLDSACYDKTDLYSVRCVQD